MRLPFSVIVTEDNTHSSLGWVSEDTLSPVCVEFKEPMDTEVEIIFLCAIGRSRPQKKDWGWHIVRAKSI